MADDPSKKIPVKTEVKDEYERSLQCDDKPKLDPEELKKWLLQNNFLLVPTQKLDWATSPRLVDEVSRHPKSHNDFIKQREAEMRNHAPPPSYNYLLLDSSLDNDGPDPVFETFCQRIFYVGKGTGERPIDHFRECRNKMDEKELTQEMGSLQVTDKTVEDLGRKRKKDVVERIAEIWNKDKKVEVFKVFFVTDGKDFQSYIRKASMIDWIKLDKLSNLKEGWYKEIKWEKDIQSQYGRKLLLEAYRLYKEKPKGEYKLNEEGREKRE